MKNHRKIYDRLKEDRQVIELDFGDVPGKLKGECLNMYDGVRSEVLYTTKFNENSDFITMYIGRTDMTRSDEIKVEERFPISKQRYTVGKLLDCTECQIFFDTTASKLFIIKMHYFRCKSLHS